MAEKLFIIIPCYNEGEHICSTLQELTSSGYSNVILVDDGSDTPIVNFVADKNVHVLRHPINLGQGAALETGMEYARRHDADAVIHFDADGQHDSSDIPAFLNALKDADLVIGSRFLTIKSISQVPIMRRLLLKIACFVNFMFCHIWLSDAHNGFRALNRKALEAICIKENRMAHASEILILAQKAKLKIKEVPTTIRYTDYSRQKGQKWYNSINIFIDLILNQFM